MDSSKTSNTNRLVGVQQLRGVAVLLVLIRHIQVFAGRYVPENGLDKLPEFGDIGVDLFFVISGFVMAYTTLSLDGTIANIRTFLLKRACRIYPLYWIVSLVVLAVYLYNPGMVNSSQGGEPTSVVKSFLLWPQKVWPLVGQGWSLIYELYFYIAFAAVLLLPRTSRPWGVLVWAILAISVGLFAFDSSTITSYPELRLMSDPLLLEFAAGCLIGFFGNRTSVRASSVLLAIGVILLLAGIPWGHPDSRWNRVFLFGPAVALMVWGVVGLDANRKWPQLKWLNLLGDGSYSIYLTHILVIAAMGRVWKALHLPGGNFACAGCSVLMFVAAIAFGLLFYLFLEKRLTKLCQFPKSKVGASS